MSYSILEQETRRLDYLKLNVVMLNDAEVQENQIFVMCKCRGV